MFNIEKKKNFYYRDNFLPHKAVELSELKIMEIKVPTLGTRIEILINNVLSGRNDHLEPSMKN